MSKLEIFALSALLSISIGCSSHYSASDEASAASATFQWLTEQHSMVSGPELDAMLHRVVGRLVRASRLTSAKRELKTFDTFTQPPDTEVPWQVFVIGDMHPNAYSAGSGLIVLTKGMLLATQAEAELAAVIGHEMSHQLLGHTSEALARQKETLSDHSASSPRSYFSLDQEIDADTYGLRLLNSAGYQPAYALTSLMIGYRQNSGSVATLVAQPMNQPGMKARSVNLKRLIKKFGYTALATENTREFNRVRRVVAGS